MGRFVAALKDFENAIKQEPDNDEFKQGLSKCRDRIPAWKRHNDE